jgi:hypothetical protein
LDSTKLAREESLLFTTDTVASTIGCLALESVSCPLITPSALWAITPFPIHNTNRSKLIYFLINIVEVRKDRRKGAGQLVETY